MALKRYYTPILALIILFALNSPAARSQPPVLETVVRKVFGTNRVVFTHNAERRLENEQRVYLYSGEKFIGTGMICSIYSDENYTCEVPPEVYESINPGDTVSELPPEKYREKLKKIRDNPKSAKATLSPVESGVADGEKETTRMALPKRLKTESDNSRHDLNLEGGELASRGDSISFKTAEEKHRTALELGNEAGSDIITHLAALASIYMDRERCNEAANLLDNHLPSALADYPSDAWGRAISAINLRANNLIYAEKFACAETVLTTLAAALEPETKDERTGFFIITIYDRLSYLYGEWGKGRKAEDYRKQSHRIKEEYDVDRYVREQDLTK